MRVCVYGILVHYANEYDDVLKWNYRYHYEGVRVGFQQDLHLFLSNIYANIPNAIAAPYLMYASGI